MLLIFIPFVRSFVYFFFVSFVCLFALIFLFYSATRNEFFTFQEENFSTKWKFI